MSEEESKSTEGYEGASRWAGSDFLCRFFFKWSCRMSLLIQSGHVPYRIKEKAHVTCHHVCYGPVMSLMSHVKFEKRQCHLVTKSPCRMLNLKRPLCGHVKLRGLPHSGEATS